MTVLPFRFQRKERDVQLGLLHIITDSVQLVLLCSLQLLLLYLADQEELAYLFEQSLGYHLDVPRQFHGE